VPNANVGDVPSFSSPYLGGKSPRVHRPAYFDIAEPAGDPFYFERIILSLEFYEESATQTLTSLIRERQGRERQRELSDYCFAACAF